MIKRPSSRRKSEASEVTLNLVPMMDCLVTMISFLLYTMSFLAFVSIESPVPVTKSSDIAEKLKEQPLQLTLTIRPTEIEVWSPFKKIPATKIANQPDGQPNVHDLHELLLGVKNKFPQETKVVVVPNVGTTYDTLVAVMDASRTITDTDAPLYVQDPKTGVSQQTKALFPDIIFGNLLGDS